MTFEVNERGLVEPVSGTAFDPFRGSGVSGPLADQVLDTIPAFTAFPSDFVTFFPDGRIWPSE